MTPSAIVLLILSILAAATAALLLYCYLRRLRLRSLPLRLSAAEVPLQSTHSSFRRVSPAPPPADGGLLLPRFRFSDVTRPGSVTVTGDCAICLSEFEPDHYLRLLPLCLHAFHVDCIDTWLAGESRICPVCRAEVFRSDSDLLRAVGGSFRVAIGSVSRGRPASSSSRVHSIRGGELEYVVEEEGELQLRDAVLPGHEDEIIDVVDDDDQPPSPEYESSYGYGVVFTGSSRRWMDLSEGIEWISQLLKM